MPKNYFKPENFPIHENSSDGCQRKKNENSMAPLQPLRKKHYGIFCQNGEITEITKEMCQESELSHIKNGVQQILLKDVRLGEIPHVAKIEKFPALISIAGRKPACLKCGDTSHVFKNCPKRNKNKSTFAEVLQAQTCWTVLRPMLNLLCKKLVLFWITTTKVPRIHQNFLRNRLNLFLKKNKNKPEANAVQITSPVKDWNF